MRPDSCYFYHGSDIILRADTKIEHLLVPKANVRIARHYQFSNYPKMTMYPLLNGTTLIK